MSDRRLLRWVALAACLAGALAGGASSSAPDGEEPDRSPIDVAVSRDGRWAVTANATSDSASLVDLAGGRVAAEAGVGARPAGIALSDDGRTTAVACQSDGTVAVLRITGAALRVEARVPVGAEPRGVAILPGGRLALAAVSGEDSVALVDLEARRVVRRARVGTEPWRVAVAPDGRTAAVGCARSREVVVLDAQTLEVRHRVDLRGGNVRHVAISPDGRWAYVPHIAERGFATTRENIDLGWVTASRLSRVPLMAKGHRQAISLDPRGRAVGDVDGATISPDGTLIALAAAGTHELLLLREPLPFVTFGGPGDHIDPDLLRDSRRFRRISVGGRPLAVRFHPDGRSVVVANYLSNALQVVDTEAGEVRRTIPLGGPAAPSLARRGEAIFYDAQRSFNQWYSCGTCHVEGHTNGSRFDTSNDGSYDTPKKTLSLRGVARTGPWTWHGWKPDLRELVRDSLTRSMQGPEPTEQDLDALMAFLKTLDFAPRRPATPESRRGEALFNARKCGSCHAPPDYTSPGIYRVGLESPADARQGFNPPSLRGVGSRAPYLHDGRAGSLSEVLARWHTPSRLTGTPDFTPDELADVLAFLRTL